MLIPDWGRCPAGACRSPTASPSHPAPTSHPQGSALRGINEGSSNSPVRASPRLWPPRWNGSPLGFPPGFAPRRPGADDARRGGGQAIEHGPGTTRSTSHQLILQSVVHSQRATSRRTRRNGSLLMFDRRHSEGACGRVTRGRVATALSEFFEPPPPPPRREPRELSLPPWIRPPSGTVPGVVPLELALARTDRFAVFVTRLAAYPEGFEFDVWALAAPGPGRGRPAGSDAFRSRPTSPSSARRRDPRRRSSDRRPIFRRPQGDQPRRVSARAPGLRESPGGPGYAQRRRRG